MDNIKQAIAELDAAGFAHLTSWITTTERSRRNTLAAVHRREDEIATGYHAVQGTLNTDDEATAPQWVQPVGAHDAWPVGALVSHAGHVWRNTAGVVNVWEPGADGPVPTWTRTDDGEGGDGVDVPLWRAGVNYITGEVVAYEGADYRVIQDHTSADHWRPDQTASLYEPR